MGALLIACLTCAPLYFIFQEVLLPPADGWKQLTEIDPDGLFELLPPDLRAELMPEQTVFSERLSSTLIILTGVASLCLIWGVITAWLVSMLDFAGKRIWLFILALPITIPTYVMATSYKLLTVDLELQSRIWVRDKMGAEVMQQFDTTWNYCLCIFVLSASLYPYVYLASCSAFCSISNRYLESAQLLSNSPWYRFRRITLPLARPSIIGGLTLVCLETLNEFGAMKILGIETLLTEIFRIHSGSNDLNTATRVSACIMVIVILILILEHTQRRRQKFHQSQNSKILFKGKRINSLSAIFVTAFLALSFLISFALPVSKIIQQACYGLQSVNFQDYLPPILNSFKLAAFTALTVIALSLFLSYSNRLIPRWWMESLQKICGFGYAIPGAILGISIVTWTGGLLQNPSTTDLINTIFYHSIYGLVIAYTIRFMTVGLQPIDAGLRQIRTDLDETAATMGTSRLTTFLRIHLPLLRPALLSAFLILFIDVLKELPLTLILSPFNTETLATQTYSLFKVQEEYAKGSVPALLLIIFGILSMLIIRLLIRPNTQK